MTKNAIEMVQKGHTKPAVAAGQPTGKASGHNNLHTVSQFPACVMVG